MKFVQDIRLKGDSHFSSYSDYQELYLDYSTKRLKPNTKIYIDDQLFIEVNSYGCKGADINQEQPVMAFFGCSVTFGVSTFTSQSWANQVSLPPYESLNAGIEGADLEMMVERYHELTEQLDLDVVVVYPGWHNIVYNDTTPEYWESKLDQLRGSKHTAIITPSCSLTEDLLETGIESLLTESDENSEGISLLTWLNSLNSDYFNFWGGMPHDLDNVKKVFYAHKNFCSFLRHYCERKDVQCIDLEAHLKPQSISEVPKNHFDILHLRAPVYDQVSQFISGQLQESLG